MKPKFYAAFAAVLVLCSLPYSANAIMISLSPSDTEILTGQSFAVGVFADDVDPNDQLLAFGFDVVGR